MSLQVVVMRALEQAKPLMDALKDDNLFPLLIPMLSIHSVILTEDMINTTLKKITEAHYVMITSANVITHLPPRLITALKDALIITMGQGTSASLTPYGLSPVFTAPSGSTSESLLDEPILAAGHIRDKSIVLLSGKGGRTHITETLSARGAQVHTVLCYEAIKPPHLDLTLQFLEWQQAQEPICFLITSQKILTHLLSFTPPTALVWLKCQILIVVSERIKDVAMQLGFQQIIVSGSADVAGLKAAVYTLINLK